jgi:hypothetical protein
MDEIFAPQYMHLVRTRAYIKALPNGLTSYPECRSKGQVWKNILRCTDTQSLIGRVPPKLIPEADVLAGTWIPITQSFAAHLVLRDCLFASDEAICEHFRQVDRSLLSGPVYRVMFALATPMLAIHAADRRFAAMFEGISLHAHSPRAGQVTIELQYPRLLLPALIGRLYLIAFEVAVELAGGKLVKGTALSHDDTEASYEIVWRS